MCIASLPHILSLYSLGTECIRNFLMNRGICFPSVPLLSSDWCHSVHPALLLVLLSGFVSALSGLSIGNNKKELL